jgi:multiple sugar transport system permease protein
MTNTDIKTDIKIITEKSAKIHIHNSGKIISKVIYNTSMLIFSLVMVYPILWMIMSSFKGNSEIFTNASSLLPDKFLIENYVKGWNGFGGTTFTTFFTNSLVISISSTIGAVISSVLVAYGFSRVPFKGQKIMFTVMLMTMMLPYQIIAIPQYVIYQKLDLINSFLPLILPNFFGFPFFIFLNMQFIRGIPIDLDEAAYIDGCNKYSIFFKIILPLLKPSIVTSAIFSFYWRWEDFFAPLLYLNKPKLYTIPLALRIFADPTSVSNWSGMLAMATLSLVPVLVIFFIFQKYLVDGIATSGIKG